jgi:3-hydroxybutyryl-CoA dehydratase
MATDFAPGMCAETRRAFDAAELHAYAHLTGDARAATRVPEPMIGALFSFLLGTRLPGRGTNYLRQRLSFHAAALPGEELCARVEVTRVRSEQALVNLATSCHGLGGRLIASGEALVLVADCPPAGAED